MWAYDLATLRFLAVNEAAVLHYGYSRAEFLAMTIAAIRPDEDVPRLRAELVEPLDERSGPRLWRHRKKDGTVIDVLVSATTFELGGRHARLVLAQDVTEQRGARQRAWQAEKLEAVGSLAGGIAHDFNNVLTIVRACAQLLGQRVVDDESRREVAEIDLAVQRGTELTQRLLAFSRNQTLEPGTTDLNAAVAETVTLLDHVLGTNIELVADYDAELAPVRLTRTQVTQIVLNLALNSRDAMPHGGRVILRTGRGVVEAPAPAEPVPCVLLEVADNGTGMDAEARRRAFEPFFTTKENGTGFGLATVQRIVAQSGGTVTLRSKPGRGTTFTMRLPVAD